MWLRPAIISMFITAIVVSVSAGLCAAQEEKHFVIVGDENWKADFEEHWALAKKYVDEKRFKKAVNEALWCLEHRPDSHPEYENNLTQAMVEFIYDISTFYKYAGKKLEQRREVLEKRFLAGDADYGDGLEFHEINDQLGEWYRTAELYRKLGEMGAKGKRMQREMFQFVEESLLEDGEYAQLLTGAGDGPASLDRRFALVTTRLSGEQSTDKLDPDATRLLLCRSAGCYYEALLCTGKKDEASTLAAKCIQFHKKGDTYAVFVRHAINAKKYSTARRLAKEAKVGLPREEYRTVRTVAKDIPKKKTKKSKK